MNPVLVTVAREQEAGVTCPHCTAPVRAGEAVAACPRCGRIQHQACWTRSNGCGSYDCAPARRDLGQADPALTISAADLERAVPLPVSRPGGAVHVPTQSPTPSRPRTSRLAIAALVCALAGIPLFGVITGLVAIILGSIALGSIRATQQKGLVLAMAGVLIGLADVVGWIVLISWALSGGPARLHSTAFLPNLNALDNLEPTLNRAMRANVLIEHRRGFVASSIGSGVIVRICDGEVLILTNRHVVDPDFDPSKPAAGKPNTLTPDVMLVDQSVRPGEVVWQADGGIDLALVRVACHSKEIMATKWRLGCSPRLGDPVFAIGNPHGLGWTHTQGAISQFRIQECDGLRIPVLQTQTVINPGNSGGGLYDKAGFLIGINTWTQDKRVSEGLNFAIALDALRLSAPPQLNLEAGSQENDQP